MPEKNTKRLNWEKYTWIDFERICFEYAKEKYNSTIYKVKITQAQKDGGRDIVISDTQNNRTAWGECKHHKRNIDLSDIGKNVVLAITNEIQKIIFFSVSEITVNTKHEILKAAMIHNFDVLFLDGAALDYEISGNKNILNKYFSESFELYNSNTSTLTASICIDESKCANSNAFKEGSSYYKLENGLDFYFHIFLKNYYLKYISNICISLPETSEYHLYKNVIKTERLKPFCDAVFSVHGILLNTEKVASVAANIINYMQENGNKCVIAYSVYDPAIESMIDIPCEMIKVDAMNFPGSYMIFGMGIHKVYRHYCQKHKDEKVICHVHNVQALGSCANWSDIPLICTLHSLCGDEQNVRLKISNMLYTFALKRLIRYNKKITSVSKAIVDYYANSIDKRKIEVIYNGCFIDINKRSKQKKFTIGHVGNLSMAKGWDTLFNAFVLLPDDQKQKMRLMAAGKETEMFSYEKMDQLISQNNLCGLVECLGYISCAKDTFIPQLDILVLASRNEGLGLVQVEAMGYGIPVLGRAVGGITEILENGYNGFVIKDEYDLAQKISLLATDRELYKRLSVNARATYESRFTLEKMCDAYKNLYYEIL